MSAWCEFKIVRMFGWQEEPVSLDDLLGVVLDLQLMGPWHGLQIYPDAQPAPDGHWQFPRLSIGWHKAGGGYLVQYFETVRSDSCLLATAGFLSEPEIYIEFNGLGQEEWPKELFVPYRGVVKATEHFLGTGQQDPSLDWIGLGNFRRRRVEAGAMPR
jgi:hypothetical protein